MKLSLKEKEYIYKKLWEAKLKNELCKSKTLIKQIEINRPYQLSFRKKEDLQKYITNERKKISRNYIEWRKRVIPLFREQFDFIPEKVIKRWEYLGLLEKMDLEFLIFVLRELFYCLENGDLSDEDIDFTEESLY
jgi:hypothetical protein